VFRFTDVLVVSIAPNPSHFQEGRLEEVRFEGFLDQKSSRF
jgi:hypothetical protein